MARQHVAPNAVAPDGIGPRRDRSRPLLAHGLTAADVVRFDTGGHAVTFHSAETAPIVTVC